MSIVTIEFLGGPETGNVGETTWANPFTNESLILPIREKVRVDPTASAFFASVVKKARTNRFFKVEDIDDIEVVEAAPRRRGRAKAAEEASEPVADDGDEEQG